MGLDNYFYKFATDEDGEKIPVPEDPSGDSGYVVELYPGDDPDFIELSSKHEINLIGGMMSGNGANGSFRGKCYSDMVEHITGISLYEDCIDPLTVKKMGEMMLAGYKDYRTNDGVYINNEYGDDNTKDDLWSLGMLFTIAGDLGYSCVSWY